MFETRVYTERRKKLMNQLDSGVVLLLGNSESPMNYASNVYPFRQDSNFLYFCGLDLPGLAMVVDVDSGDEILFGDDFSLDDTVWMGPQPTVAKLAEQAGISTHGPRSRLQEVISDARSRSRTVHFLPPYRQANMAELQGLLDIAPTQQKDSASLDLIKAVVDLRSIKSPEEIAEIEEAVSLTTQMHLAAMQAAGVGQSESAVMAEVVKIALAGGGRTSFPPIVSVHGEILHNPHHHGKLNSGDLLLCDAGAEITSHYCGDMTRTFPVDGTFNDRQRDIYSIVLAAEEAASSALTPGVPYLDLHMLAARTIATGLKDLGLMRGDLDAAVAAGAHALFFPHGLGHMMGLDVHDMEDLGEDHVGYASTPRSSQFGLKSLRLARELQSGFVLTVEPGIYFIPPLIQRWRDEEHCAEYIDYSAVESYLEFGGIRIEEDFLITDDGGKLLGTPLPKSIADIEDMLTI